ncbi:MAG: hypothetical protein J6A07_10510 [Firmicutes bacterium]|nr:hypothetical protein [Bacillota bacterium]
MRKIIPILCISVLLFSAGFFLGIKLYEKHEHEEEVELWEEEQERYTKGDIVVYEQENDRFGWLADNKIEQVYRTGTGSYAFSIEDERYESFASINFRKVFDSLTFPEEDKKPISGRQWSVEELQGTELEFLCDKEIYEGRKRDVYIWDDKCIVLRYTLYESDDNLYGANIYTIKTGERYMYPIALMRNQPKGVRPGSGLINPKYYFCKDGRIFWIYKFYNKLYCHRLN